MGMTAKNGTESPRAHSVIEIAFGRVHDFMVRRRWTVAAV